MGTHVIKMPDIGEGIAEVELSVWHVKVGDMVVEDQVLADVMTDKAMVDIPSPVHGKVISLGGEPGEVMAVGSILISIEVEGAGNTKESALSAVVEQAAPAPRPTSRHRWLKANRPPSRWWLRRKPRWPATPMSVRWLPRRAQACAGCRDPVTSGPGLGPGRAHSA